MKKSLLAILYKQIQFHSDNGQADISSIGFLINETHKTSGNPKKEVIELFSSLIRIGFIEKVPNEKYGFRIKQQMTIEGIKESLTKPISIKCIQNKFNSEIKLKFVFFWGHTKTEAITSSCFSQWYASEFIVEGIKYYNTEQWMMAQKALLFDDKEIYTQILQEFKPGKIKELGRQVKNFNQEVWEKNRFKIVVDGNLHKFQQNKPLLEYLINTKERVLVEASPIDKIWGVGLAHDNPKINNPNEWEGLNLLGFALMKIRGVLNMETA